MRGDSLRDFYAKTLAVVGLGLLAAAGAIVDYWPVNGDWPTVPAGSALRAARPLPVPELAREVPAPRIIRASYQRASYQPGQRATAPPFAKAFRAVHFVEPVVAPPEPPPIPELDLSRMEPAPPAALLAMSSIQLDLEPPMPEMPVSIGGGGLSSSRAILTGAVSALKKTRTSLRDALRGVVGRIRKVSPFWDATIAPF